MVSILTHSHIVSYSKFPSLHMADRIPILWIHTLHSNFSPENLVNRWFDYFRNRSYKFKRNKLRTFENVSINHKWNDAIQWPVFGDFWICPSIFWYMTQYQSISTATTKCIASSLLYLYMWLTFQRNKEKTSFFRSISMMLMHYIHESAKMTWKVFEVALESIYLLGNT